METAKQLSNNSILYKYIYETGEKFECIGENINDCRLKRDKWLKFIIIKKTNK